MTYRQKMRSLDKHNRQMEAFAEKEEIEYARIACVHAVRAGQVSNLSFRGVTPVGLLAYQPLEGGSMEHRVGDHSECCGKSQYWTAQEREAGERSSDPVILRTVSALIEALENLVGDEGWIEDHEDETVDPNWGTNKANGEHEYCAYCKARALLDSLK